jgi:hypothetical protein
VTGPKQRPARGLTWQMVRRAALALPGVEDGTSYGTAALFVRKKLLARLREEEDSVAVRTDPYSRDLLLAADPRMYFLTDHYRDYPWILVRLSGARLAPLRDLLEGAWRQLQAKKIVAGYDGRPARRPSRQRA